MRDNLHAILDFTSRAEFLDLLELVHSRRQACRVSVEKTNMEFFLRFAQQSQLAFGFSLVAEYKTDVFGSNSDLINQKNGYEVYVGKDQAAVSELMVLFESGSSHKAIGEAFGYPGCCIKMFEKSSSASNSLNENYYFLQSAIGLAINSGLTSFSKIMSPLLNYRVNSFFPCRFDCENAEKLAKKRLSLLEIYSDWKPLCSQLVTNNVIIDFKH